MLTAEMLEIRSLQEELAAATAINRGADAGDVKLIFREKINHLRPVDDLSTDEIANEYRYLPAGEGGGKFKFETAKFPYVKEIHDELDNPLIRLVLVKGPARSIKTTSAENHLLKIGMFGPDRNVLWYMHSTSDLEDYVEERGEFFIWEHEAIAAKVGPTPRERSRLRKKVGGKIWRWLAANKSTTRGKAAPYIVVDEVDAMRKDIRGAITTLIRNRQRDFGNMAKAYIASHSDEGPNDGIDKLLIDSDLRVRMWKCRSCGRLAGPAVEAPAGRRIVWNVPQLMKEGEDLEREELIEFVASNVALICPHCQVKIDNDTRLELDQDAAGAFWLRKGEAIDDNERVIGKAITTDTAGFVTHAFMSRLVSLYGLAKEYVEAKLTQMETGDARALKEVSVKSLGETFRLDVAASKPRDWKVIRGRLVDTGYRSLTVPRGVDFLTAMIDVGGAKFDVGIIGWSHLRESWLIHRFTIAEIQRPGERVPRAIDPGNRLADWDVLEEKVLHKLFPLNDGSGRMLGIAKMGIDSQGVAGVTDNARLWASNLMARAEAPIPSWRIALLQGKGNLKEQKPGDQTKKTKGELYTRPREITVDAAERELPVPVLERTVFTDDVKFIIADRMEIETPGPAMMHLPSDVEDKHVREMTAETYTNGVWHRRGANELWDLWVGAEVCRSLLAPDSAEIDWQNARPSWATPFLLADEDDIDRPATSFVDRLAGIGGKRPQEEY